MTEENLIRVQTAYEYSSIAHRTIDTIVATQLPAINAAVDLIARSLLGGGILHVFGTGHARLPMHEMAGRAGGLMPIDLMRIGDLVMWGERAPEEILDPTLERDPSLAQAVYDLAAPRPGDCFLIASNSGINGSVVEMASLVTARGHGLVALTSVAHSTAVPSRHPSGAKLLDYADIVIDTGAPAGDATLRLSDGTMVGAVSNLAGVVIVQLLTEGIARRYIQAGERPPVYRSMNLPDGDEVNAENEARYRQWVRPIEP